MFRNYYQGKKVLVTGHTGFKGAWLSYWLHILGAKVCGFSSYIPSVPSLFEVLHLSTCIEDHRGDIRDLEKLRQTFNIFEPEIVFHLAAQPIVRFAYNEPKITFDTNVSGTVNVLESIRLSDSVKSAVLITSDKCYENVEWEYGYRENDTLGGKDPYSASKACAEIAISAYWRSFIDASGKKLASTRAGNVIGGGDWAVDRIVPDAIKAWSANKSLTLRAPNATRPWQHVLEPLSGYLCLGEKLDSEPALISGQAFNFGPAADVNQSVADLIREMASHWDDAKWMVEESAMNKSEAGLLKLSCDKALHRLAWQNTLCFEEVVRYTADWYKSYYQDRANIVDITTAQIGAYQVVAEQRGREWTNVE